MPRSLRVEYEGARYHVLNRGNYRRALFEVHRTGEVFRETLYQTCERYGWILHAYVVMSNHYHLALETPLGNLAAGGSERGQGSVLQLLEERSWEYGQLFSRSDT